MDAGNLHAIDFVAFGEEGAERLLAIVRVVHGVNRGASEPLLGIDFPLWQGEAEASQDPDAALRVLRVLGEKAALEMFNTHPSVRRAVASGVGRTVVYACPETAHWVRLGRDSRAEKHKPSHSRRQARRHAGKAVRGHAGGRVVLALPMASSTGNRFRLKLRKTPVQPAPRTVTFNSYGLCKEGAVPQYAPVWRAQATDKADR
jgi:hypothetical protein